jgi:excisionase family DNA binding protein
VSSEDKPGRVIGPPLLLTVEEAATSLRIGRTRTYQLVMAGRIQSVKLGRRRLVVRAGLERFVHELAGETGED